MSQRTSYKSVCRRMGDGSFLLTEDVAVPIRIFMSDTLVAECEEGVA